LCPAGDECNCVEEANNGQVESWAALRGAMMKGRERPAKLNLLPSAAVEASDDEKLARGKNDWERVELNVPSREQGGLAVPQSPAALSFGRLKKAGTWSRPSSLRGPKRKG
jgi:hypothetical protein